MPDDFKTTTTSWSSISIPSLIILILCMIGLWKIFVKAGQAGWKSLIPIYNIIILLEITGKPCWWTFLFFIPIIDIIFYIIVMVTLADCFNKTTRFKIGLILLPFIFEFILGFDDSQYTPPIRE